MFWSSDDSYYCLWTIPSTWSLSFKGFFIWYNKIIYTYSFFFQSQPKSHTSLQEVIVSIHWHWISICIPYHYTGLGNTHVCVVKPFSLFRCLSFALCRTIIHFGHRILITIIPTVFVCICSVFPYLPISWLATLKLAQTILVSPKRRKWEERSSSSQHPSSLGWLPAQSLRTASCLKTFFDSTSVLVDPISLRERTDCR